MTKEEAQAIIDKIIPKTIIDSNWLDYLLAEKRLITLQALQIVSDINSYKDLLKDYEGQEISEFQTEVIENYVGRIIDFQNGLCSLIIMQDREWLYFYNTSKLMTNLSIKTINQLYKII